MVRSHARESTVGQARVRYSSHAAPARGSRYVLLRLCRVWGCAVAGLGAVARLGVFVNSQVRVAAAGDVKLRQSGVGWLVLEKPVRGKWATVICGQAGGRADSKDRLSTEYVATSGWMHPRSRRVHATSRIPPQAITPMGGEGETMCVVTGVGHQNMVMMSVIHVKRI